MLRAVARHEGGAYAVRLVAPHADRTGRLVEAERVLVKGRARRGLDRTAAPAWRAPAGRVVPYRYRPAAEADATHVLHGPSLQTLVDLVVGHDDWHAARLRAPRRRRWAAAVAAAARGACLRRSSTAASVACGALLSMRGVAGLPRGFGRVELWDAPRDGEECRALLHERAHGEREARFDFTVWGTDGRVLLVVRDFVRRSFGQRLHRAGPDPSVRSAGPLIG